MIEKIESIYDKSKDNFYEWKEKIDTHPEILITPFPISLLAQEKINELFKNGYDSALEKTNDISEKTNGLYPDLLEYTKNLTTNISQNLNDKIPEFDYKAIGEKAIAGAGAGAVVGAGFGATAAGAGAIPGGLTGGLIGGISAITGEIARQIAKHNGASDGLALGIQFGTEVATGLGAAKIAQKSVEGLSFVAKDAVEKIGETKTGEVITKQYDDVLKYSQDKIKTIGFEAKGLVNNLKNHEFIDGTGKVFIGKIDDVIDMSRTINMPYIGSHLNNTNAAGFLRDKVKFGREYLENYPETMSVNNIEKIKNNLSPIVDEQWIKFNPNHKTFLGQTLEHHHINNAGTAAYIPRDLHRGTVNKDIIHVDNMAIGLNDFKNIVKG
jgi:hypothetical protein